MNFENPGYLWGALVGLLPILIHLIQRRRAKVVEFAAIEFILSSNKRVARRYRLREMLLLALRVLLLAALPFAFAKPSLVTEASALPGAQTPTSVVIIVDPSGSMGYRNGSETLLARAIERARDIVGDLKNESDAAIVLAQSPAKALTSRLTYDRRLVFDVLGGITPTAGRADLLGALRLSEQILVESARERREVVILTDLQASDWEGMTRPWALEHSPHVTVVDVGPFKTSYLPVVQQAMAYLSGRLEQSRANDAVVGQTQVIPVPDGLESLRVVAPSGAVSEYAAADLGAGDVRYRETALPGVYTVREHRKNGVVELPFVVGTDPRESVLLATDGAAAVSILETGSATRPGGAPKAPERRADAWPMILGSLFVLLGLETWLAVQRP